MTRYLSPGWPFRAPRRRRFRFKVKPFLSDARRSLRRERSPGRVRISGSRHLVRGMVENENMWSAQTAHDEVV